jgi:type II secretory pathway component HofQ
MKKMTILTVATLILFHISTVFGGGKIYTNKDLEKYISKKAQETAVKYTGKRVTLDFSDANLVGVLSLLSDIARQDGYTLSVDSRIQGKITLKMTNVAWDQVLDFLAEKYHLVKVVKDKTIMISPEK